MERKTISLRKKANLFFALFALAIFVPIALILIFKFRSYTIQSAIDKGEAISSIVKDGLTTYMENHITDKRYDFLAKIKGLDGVQNLKILRSKAVDELFGKAPESFVKKDPLEEEVLRSGKTLHRVKEDAQSVKLKIVIPYTASAYEKPNCLQCHTNVGEGAILGAVSMEFDIGSMREKSIRTISEILLIILFVALVGVVITNLYIRDYIVFFEYLRDVLEKGYKGDCHGRLNASSKRELQVVQKWVNVLFGKIETTLASITKSVNYFINFNSKQKDPLIMVQELVKELASIYKFKNIIDRDRDTATVYRRIVELLENKFEVQSFILYKVDREKSEREILHNGIGREICPDANGTISLCRAFRSDSVVLSDKYICVCEATKSRDFYLCLPLKISSRYSLILSFVSSSKEDFLHFKEIVPNFKNYIDTAKNTIETKLLLEELHELSLKDKMTGAYNRRYLDLFTQNILPQALRDNIPYSLLMIDIDHFKAVNDSYGHDVGDRVIKSLVKTIFKNIRKSDTLVRMGGEEFLLLLHNAQKKEAQQIAQKIRLAFASLQIEAGAEKISKTISIGISEFPSESENFWQVIKYADQALYEAKESGRDRIIIYSQEKKEEG